MAHVGYGRVSTLDQDPALQLDALAAAGCSKVFEDPRFRRAHEAARPGSWLERSLPHLIETVSALEKRAVGFRPRSRGRGDPDRTLAR